MKAKIFTRQEVTMAEEGISIIKVRDVPIVTLPSSPNDRAIENLQEGALTRMAELNPAGVVIDISLVKIVDSFLPGLSKKPRK